MQTKIIILLSALLVSTSVFAQYHQSSIGELYYPSTPSEQSYANALNDNFNEFSQVYNAFMHQTRQQIATGQYKQAREALIPFLDQFRARLNFKSKATAEFALKNFSAEDIAQVRKEMVGAFIGELAVSNLSSSIREKLQGAVDSSLPERFYQSLFSYKRVLLLYITAVLGEHNAFSTADKRAFSRSIFSDFLFLVAPAISFHTAEPNLFLVLFETELNPSLEQAAFEADLIDLVKRFYPYFNFVRSSNTVEQDFKDFKVFQQNIIRRTLSIKNMRAPANAPSEAPYSEANAVEENSTPPAAVTAPNLPTEEIVPGFTMPEPLPDRPTRSVFSRPSALVMANARGALQFDLSSLTEISDSDASVEAMTQDLKVYLTSSTMIWGQNQIQFNSSFTHNNSHIKVLVKNFPLSQKFMSAAVELYFAELNIFFQFGKEALARKNTLDNRDQVYNCLVRLSLAPVTINCDGILQFTSMFDEMGRKKFSDAYTRLLRFSRITFEFNTAGLEYLPETETTCARIRSLQKEMLQSYRSTANSYFPNLINIQGPSFKNTSTGKREFLCQGSLNPFLQ